MTFTVTLLPSASDTHGSHSPKVTTPLLSIAPRSPRGRRSVTALPMDEPRSTDEQNLISASRVVRRTSSYAWRIRLGSSPVAQSYNRATPIPVQKQEDSNHRDGDLFEMEGHFGSCVCP